MGGTNKYTDSSNPTLGNSTINRNPPNFRWIWDWLKKRNEVLKDAGEFFSPLIWNVALRRNSRPLARQTTKEGKIKRSGSKPSFHGWSYRNWCKVIVFRACTHHIKQKLNYVKSSLEELRCCAVWSSTCYDPSGGWLQTRFGST